MSKASAGKKQQIVLVGIATFLVMALIHTYIISPLHASMRSASDQIADAEAKLSKYKRAMQKSAEIQAEAGELGERLDKAEATLPKGDAYLWMLDSIQSFKERPNIEFSQIEPPQPAEPKSIPALPYPNLAYDISGAAYFGDFGLFLADFENAFPYLRLRSLELEPAAAGRAGEDEREKLRFRFGFVTPAKPSQTAKP